MKQFAVIGLGNFGFYLASNLYEKGHEVLAIDLDPSLVQKIRDNVSQAVVADATDPEAMKALGLKEMDKVILCIGSVLDNSILSALNLLEIGVKQIMAKALSEPQGRILNKIGISEVVFPEKDQAASVCERLHNPNVLDFLPFVDGYSIVQLAVPAPFVGKSIMDLNLINSYGVQIVAVKEIVPDRMNMIPTAKFVLKDSDLLILLGPNKALEKLRKI